MQNAFCSEDQRVNLDKLGPPEVSKILALLQLHSNTSHLPFSQPVRPHNLTSADQWAYSEAPVSDKQQNFSKSTWTPPFYATWILIISNTVISKPK